jgi:hypothetical protein
MSNVSDKLQYSVSSSLGSTSLSGYDTESGNSEVNFSQSFPANSVNTSISLALTPGNLQSVFLLSDKGCTIRTNGLNTADVQTVSISGTPTGGSFPLAFGGDAVSLAYNTNAATMQSTLQGMPTIGASNVTCSGGPLPGTAIICTFAGSLNSGQQSLMTTSSASLTGGTSPTVSVAHTTPGLPSNIITLTAGIPFVWGTSTGYGTNPFAGVSAINGAYVTTTAAAQLQMKILTL